MSNFLGTLTITAGKTITFDAPNQGVKAILIGNESGLTCTITMQSGGVQKTLYPSTLDWFQVHPGFTGKILVTPQALLNNVSTFPASILIFDAIGVNDPEQASMYPLTLNRNTNIGNSVNTVGGGSTSVQNDNNAALTSVVEATQSGSSGSNVSIDNSGNITIKQWAASTLTTIFQVIAGGATAVKLAATGVLTEVLGGLTVDQNLTVKGSSSLDNGTITSSGAGALTVQAGASLNTVSGNTTVGGTLSVSKSSSLDNGSLSTDGSGGILFSGHLGVASASDVLDAGSATVTYLKVRSAGTFIFQTPNGTQVVSIDSSGNLQLNGFIKSPNGSDIVDASANTDLTLNAPNAGSGHRLNLNVGGVNQAYVDANGLTLTSSSAHGVTFPNGNFLPNISFFTGTGSGTYNHTFGSAPFWVAPIVTATNSSATQGYDTVTSTQVHVTLGSSLAFKAFCG